MLNEPTSPVDDRPVSVIVAFAIIVGDPTCPVANKLLVINTLFIDLVVAVPRLDVIAKPVKEITASPLATTETDPSVALRPGTPATAEACAATVPNVVVPTKLGKVKLAVPVTLVSVPKAEVIAKLGAFISTVVKAVTLPKAEVIPKPETVIVLV